MLMEAKCVPVRMQGWKNEKAARQAQLQWQNSYEHFLSTQFFD
ncbi:hypothetical protein [Desulfovibrio sp. 86]|nr:hypothetical protein [Desulfovibrio sp. 86]